MLGAITGDIIGSIYENFSVKHKNFRLFYPFSFFTDDTVLTVAVAEALLKHRDVAQSLRRYAWRRPLRGYGPRFYKWLITIDALPYNSFGNGAAMRVSAAAYIGQTQASVLDLAARSAACTHSHPEGIKGAQAVAAAIFYARQGKDKKSIRYLISRDFSYHLDRTVEEIRPNYRLSLTAPGSVPEAIISFLDSNDYEDAIRNAVSLGGDADTQAAIAGAIAEAFYGGVPLTLARPAWQRLPDAYRRVLLDFHQVYPLPTDLKKL